MKRRSMNAAPAIAFCAVMLGAAHAAQVTSINAPLASSPEFNIEEDLATPALAERNFVAPPANRKASPLSDPEFDYFDLAITPMKKGLTANVQFVDLREIITGEERPLIVKAPEIPAPGAIFLMLTGLAAFAGMRRRA